MSRYTLGEADKYGWCKVLDNGTPTNASARADVSFSDVCDVYDGKFYDGVFHDGVFYDGVFRGGWFRGGKFYGGVFRGGMFCGGVFYDGVFRGGEFHDGVFRGGVFHDGMFRGGEFYDGRFRGGVFRGGVFCGGWLPLQIQGSRHCLNIPNSKTIQIGCESHAPEVWLKRWAEIGAENGYTEAQCAEYLGYIKLAAEHIKRAAA